MSDEIAYVLRNGKVGHDVIEWARHYENPSYRRVAVTEFRGPVIVSTVWQGIDLGWDQRLMERAAILPPAPLNRRLYRCAVIHLDDAEPFGMKMLDEVELDNEEDALAAHWQFVQEVRRTPLAMWAGTK